jgi:hypothetical protein
VSAAEVDGLDGDEDAEIRPERQHAESAVTRSAT